MASTNWLEIYQNPALYPNDVLLAEAVTVRKLASGFSQQTSPTGRSYAVEIGALEGRLSALSRVMTERGLSGIAEQPMVGVADFSRMNGERGLDRFPSAGAPFTRVFGDGIALVFAISHGLNTTLLSSILVRERATGRILGQGTEYTVAVAGADTISLTFSVAPGVDALAVTIAA